MARNIAEVRIIGTVENQDYVNVLHFANDSNLIPDIDPTPLLDALALAVIQCFVQHILPILTPSFQLVRVTAKMLEPQVGDEVESVAGAGPGQASSVDGLPSFVSVKIEKRTGGGGRSGRGRMYLPAPPESRSTLSQLDVDGLAAFNAWVACMAGKFIGPAKTSDWEIGVLSRKQNILFPNVIWQRFRGMKQMLVSPELAIMGRRKIGKGS